jgi:hypothetical protein
VTAIEPSNAPAEPLQVRFLRPLPN